VERIVKLSKKTLGVRVDAETQANLKRAAATEGISINHLVERILLGHLSARQQGHKATDWESGLRELEQWMADRIERLQREINAMEKRQEKSLTAIRVMLDAQVQTRDPERANEYRQLVTATMRQLGIPFGSRNGGHRE
jgi:hypothetical protein